ncbi:MAG: type II secretion system protein GspD [Gammaproteobacteria bacterium]|nr:type II secretion system protein GspD [Gammaproteobacteria bacterium]|tara:strand:- start:59108 stop:61030 length:1923 start_codon:yes stop_codon:yes gene_type:complete
MKRILVKSLVLASCLSFSAAVLSQNQASINFRDADINTLVESVAEITGRSFVMDPRVRGNVTIIAPNTINADMLYQAFLSALQVHGFQAVEDGAVVRIVPFNQAFGVLGGGDNEIETRLIKVDYVDAQSLAPVIRQVISTNARVQAFAESNYLVVSDIRSNVQEVIAMIEEMDQPSEAEIEVITLEYISAGEAVHIVSELQQIQEQGLQIVEDTLNNRVIISGPAPLRNSFRNMLRTLDVPTERESGVDVIHLNYAKAVNLKPILDSMMQSSTFLLSAGETDEEGNAQSSYRVEVDESNNSLIIAASPSVVRELRRIIDQLDILKPQVLIEAVIAEVSRDQAERLSAQVIYADQQAGGYLTRFDNLLATIIGVGSGDIDINSDVANAAIGNFQGAAIGGGDFDAAEGRGFGLLIQALETDTSTRVLSTPSIVTLDNEEGYISVGTEVPFLTGSFTSTNNSATNPFQTIERNTVGIELTVTPQVSDNNLVRLTIEQSSSSLLASPADLGTADVVTAERQITTNVMVEDRQFLILGGLRDDQYDNSESRVPILGSMPLLGPLFRSTNNGDDQGVLMVFIRPTIIRDSASATEISNSRFDYLIRRDLSVDEEESTQFSESIEEIRMDSQTGQEEQEDQENQND